MKSRFINLVTSVAKDKQSDGAHTRLNNGRNSKSRISRRNAVCFSLLLVSMFSTASLFAQSKKNEQQIAAWQEELKYEVKGTDIVFTKVFEDIPGSKEEIFTNVLNYLAVLYAQSKDVIQQKDERSGVIIGKAVFFNPLKLGLLGQNVSTVYGDWYDHMIRVDVKETKVRVVFTCDQYTRRLQNEATIRHLTSYYPFDKSFKMEIGMNKELAAGVFIWLCEEINRTFIGIEKSLREASSLNNAEW